MGRGEVAFYSTKTRCGANQKGMTDMFSRRKIAPPRRKTVDQIVENFKGAIQELRELAVQHENSIAVNEKAMEMIREENARSTQEAVRAKGVANKLCELIT